MYVCVITVMYDCIYEATCMYGNVFSGLLLKISIELSKHNTTVEDPHHEEMPNR